MIVDAERSRLSSRYKLTRLSFFKSYLHWGCCISSSWLVSCVAMLVVSLCFHQAIAQGADSPSAGQADPRTYVFAGAFLAHPYVRDIKHGLKFAERKLGVRIVTLGPQGPEWGEQIAAMEQAIAMKPDGIIVPLWSDKSVPLVKRARFLGIPVIAIEAAPEDHGANTYIGLDNYRTGVLTARELIRRGGNVGKLGIVLNYRTNTILKTKGLMDGLKGTDWEVVAEVENESNTDHATQVAIDMFRDHPEITGVVGLNSSAGVGIGNAIGQLGLQGSELTAIVHDREDVVLDHILQGTIDATIVSKTALMSYLAASILDDYSRRRGNDVPVAADAAEIGLSLLPETIHVGSVVVDRANVDNFLRSSLPKLTDQ